MQRRLRLAASTAILAVAASLTVAPGALSPASATPVAARASATAQCTAAKNALAAAKASQAAAHRKVVKARKAVRKAKHAHRPAKVRKAKRVLKRWQHRYAVRSQDVRVRTARVGSACAAPNSAAKATGTGTKLDLLTVAAGAVPGTLDVGQLTILLDRLLPGVTDALDAGQLTALLGGFNTGALDLSSLTTLLGGSFSQTDLQALLAGSASPTVVLALVEDIVGDLAGLGGLPVPGSIDPTGVLTTIAGMFGTLDAGQLGGLVNLLLAAVGQGGQTLDATQLTDLLDGLIPGLASQFSPADLTAMLTAVNAGSLDAGTLSNLLGGAFDPTQITSVLGGSGSTDLVGDVLATIAAELGAFGGGGLVVPGLDASVLTDLVSTVTDLVDGVLGLLGGGGGGGGGGLVCTLLPILC
jgi:hypothetical protein